MRYVAKSLLGDVRSSEDVRDYVATLTLHADSRDERRALAELHAVLQTKDGAHQLLRSYKTRSRDRIDNRFNVGDQVYWVQVSVSTPKVRTPKQGRVVAVLEPGEAPIRHLLLTNRLCELGLDQYRTARLGKGAARRHVSYLILVENYLYWPVVSRLRLLRSGGGPVS